jgi:hypothetical protein
MFIVKRTNKKNKNLLKPDDELLRAITGDEVLQKVNLSLDKFFAYLQKL